MAGTIRQPNWSSGAGERDRRDRTRGESRGGRDAAFPAGSGVDGLRGAARRDLQSPAVARLAPRAVTRREARPDLLASRVVASLRPHGLATEERLFGIDRCVHIHAKQAYLPVGETENCKRRRPARDKAIERLLCLDYVLNHPYEPWLPTEGGKTRACEEAENRLCEVAEEGVSSQARRDFIDDTLARAAEAARCLRRFAGRAERERQSR